MGASAGRHASGHTLGGTGWPMETMADGRTPENEPVWRGVHPRAVGRETASALDGQAGRV